MLLTALGGGNLIHDVGYVESGMTASYQQLVSMNEVAGLVKRIMRGVELNSETVPLDLIDRVGPGGHFLGEEHTFNHFRRNWIPELFDRSPRDEWEQDGELTLGDRAAARVRHILEHHEPAPLDEDIASALERTIQRAEERVR
jgi:trimethylamine--corrinoid protein Co-methyltransferase